MAIRKVKAKRTKGANVRGEDSGSVLNKAKKVYDRWLMLPDNEVLDFMFGVVFANRLEGDPVWGGVVAASGDAKTEVLRSLDYADNREVMFLSNLTRNTLISGLPSSMTKGKEEPSLLDRLDGLVLVIKDLTPLISGHRETRDEILGQLRDAYDGSTAKAYGTGEVKEFNARFGLLFGVTPAIEGCWPVVNKLGERFLYFRKDDGNEYEKAKAAFKNSNHKKEMRDELAEAAKNVLNQEVNDDVVIPEVIQEQIIKIAAFTARARTPVEREGRTEVIKYAPVAEVGTRLCGQLANLARGIACARGQNDVDESIMRVIRHVAVSGIPRIQATLLSHLSANSKPLSTAIIAKDVTMGTSSIRRKLHDLWALGLLECKGCDKGSIHKWCLKDETRKMIEATKLFLKNDE